MAHDKRQHAKMVSHSIPNPGGKVMRELLDELEITEADNTRLQASLAAAKELADAICHVYMVLIDAGDIEQADAITKARNKFLATLPKQDSEDCLECEGSGEDSIPRGPLYPVKCEACGSTDKRPDTEEEP